MSSLLCSYEGPAINPSSIWSVVKMCQRNGKAEGLSKEDILKKVRKSYVEELWSWVDQQVSESISIAVKIGLIEENRQSGSVKYRAHRI